MESLDFRSTALERVLVLLLVVLESNVLLIWEALGSGEVR